MSELTRKDLMEIAACAGFVVEEVLMAVTGYTQRNALIRHLRQEVFEVHIGKGGRAYVVLHQPKAERRRITEV